MALTNVTLAGNVTSLTSTGGAEGLILSSTSGTLAINGGSITKDTSGSIVISGGAINLTYSGNVNQSGGAAAIQISGGHGGTVTFHTGTIAISNNSACCFGGVDFDNADGTYDFAGPLSITGGRTAIRVIGGSGGVMSFGSASSVADQSNVTFDIVNSAPLFTYAGSFSGSPQFSINAAFNTGGTIRFNGVGETKNMSSISIHSSPGTSLEFLGGGLNVTGIISASHGGSIVIAGPDNTLNGAIAIDRGGAVGAGGLEFKSISASGMQIGILLENAGVGNVTVSGGTISATSTAVQITGGSGNVSLRNMTISGSSTIVVIAPSVDISNCTVQGAQGIFAFGSTVSVTNNSIHLTQSGATGIGINAASGSTNATVTGNMLTGGAPFGTGIRVGSSAAGASMTARIESNGVDGNGTGIVLEASGGGSSQFIAANNTVSNANSRGFVAVSSGSLCLSLGSNTIDCTGGGCFDYRVSNSGSFQIQGLTGAVDAFVAGTNSVAGATVEVAGGGYTSGTCVVP
jgi:hypothetical protein